MAKTTNATIRKSRRKNASGLRVLKVSADGTVALFVLKDERQYIVVTVENENLDWTLCGARPTAEGGYAVATLSGRGPLKRLPPVIDGAYEFTEEQDPADYGSLAEAWEAAGNQALMVFETQSALGAYLRGQKKPGAS